MRFLGAAQMRRGGENGIDIDGREPSPTCSTRRSTSSLSSRSETRTLGRRALRFKGEHAGSGRRLELVALPDGGAFDLLGMSG